MGFGPRPCPLSVTLTKVRVQGHGRCAVWLWILTFVRMTGFEGSSSSLGAIPNLVVIPAEAGIHIGWPR